MSARERQVFVRWGCTGCRKTASAFIGASDRRPRNCKRCGAIMSEVSERPNVIPIRDWRRAAAGDRDFDDAA